MASAFGLVGSGWLSQLIIPISAVVITCGLLGIAIYFTIKGLGHSFDHLFHKTEPVAPDPTDFESEAPPDWSGTFWVALVSGLLATASIVLLYYLRDDPITETPVVLERDQSVLENIPDELREDSGQLMEQSKNEGYSPTISSKDYSTRR